MLNSIVFQYEWLSFTLEDLVLFLATVGYTAWWSVRLRLGIRLGTGWKEALDFLIFLAEWGWLQWVAFGAVGEILGPITPWNATHVAYYMIAWSFGVAFVGFATGALLGRGSLRISPDSEGRLVYTGGLSIPIFWFLLWCLEFVVDKVVLLGYSILDPFGQPVPPIPTVNFLYGVLLLTTIYGFGAAMMLGFSGAVLSARDKFGVKAFGSRRAYRAAMRSNPSLRGRFIQPNEVALPGKPSAQSANSSR